MMNHPRSTKVLWLVVFATALVLRVGCAFYWQRGIPDAEPFTFHGSHSYWELGRAVAQGGPYQNLPQRQQVYHTPGYPMLLAPLFVVCGENPPVLPARLMGAVFGLLSVAGVARLAFMLFDQKVALLAAGMAALYPEAVLSSVFVLAEAPFCPLMLAQLIAWLHAWRASSKRGVVGWSIAAGVACGAAVLVRPSWLLFVPFAMCIAVLCVKQRVRSFTIAAITLLLMCVVMSPWWIRNYRVTGKFVATTLQTGSKLYDGLNLRADGGSDMQFLYEFQIAQYAADRRSAPLDSTFEYRLNQRLTNAATTWAMKNPAAVASLAWVKFLRLWVVWPNSKFSSNFDFRSWPVRTFVLVGYVPLIFLAVVGVFSFAKRGWPVAVLYLPAVYFTLWHMVFVTSISDRVPPMLPLLSLSAAAALHVAWPWLTGNPIQQTQQLGEVAGD